MIKVRGFFRLCNVYIASFTIYLIATCFNHTAIFMQKYIGRTYSTDKGPVVFRILVNIMIKHINTKIKIYRSKYVKYRQTLVMGEAHNYQY
jgi:hypothetical protein